MHTLPSGWLAVGGKPTQIIVSVHHIHVIIGWWIQRHAYILRFETLVVSGLRRVKISYPPKEDSFGSIVKEDAIGQHVRIVHVPLEIQVRQSSFHSICLPLTSSTYLAYDSAGVFFPKPDFVFPNPSIDKESLHPGSLAGKVSISGDGTRFPARLLV